MNTAPKILKKIITPLIQDNSEVDISSVTDEFWNQFAIDLIKSKNETSILFLTLSNLGLNNPSYILKQYPEIYNNFIEKLAEEFLSGNKKDEIIQYLTKEKDELFYQEIIRLMFAKNEFQQLTSKKIFIEYYNKTLKKVIYKKGREDMKKNFRKWDNEMG